MDAPLKTGIVEAVGSAAMGPGARRLSKDIEAAMAGALGEIERESDAIWNDHALSAEEKSARIAAINTPDAKRARMLAARTAVKVEAAATARKAAAAAELKRKREELAAAEKAAAEAGVEL